MKTDHTHENGSASNDIEALVRGEREGRKLQLRLWLRLLSCVNLISSEIRSRLRAEFDVTLPRFDVMSQLYREKAGLRLGELSQRLMVSNGNLTGLVDRLANEGLVSRQSVAEDRRATVVKLTKKGEKIFAAMAREHESWLNDLLADIDRALLTRTMDDLACIKRSVQHHARNTDL